MRPQPFAVLVMPGHDVRDEGAPIKRRRDAIGRKCGELRRLDARHLGRPAKRETRAEALEQVVGAVERAALRSAFDYQRIAASPGADGAGGRGDAREREAVVWERRARARGAPRGAPGRRRNRGGGRGATRRGPHRYDDAQRVEAVNGLDPLSIMQHRAQARSEFVCRKTHDLARVRRVTDSHAASRLSRARHRASQVSRLGAFFPYFGNDNIGPRP